MVGIDVALQRLEALAAAQTDDVMGKDRLYGRYRRLGLGWLGDRLADRGESLMDIPDQASVADWLTRRCGKRAPIRFERLGLARRP